MDTENSKILSKKSAASESEPNRLYAFDFDHTIIEDNSDYAVQKIINESIPDEITRLCNGSTFTAYMDQVMKFIALKGVTIEQIEEFMKKLCFITGMEDLLQLIDETREKSSNNHFIIISDANEFFIKTILSKIVPNVIPNAVFTNYGILPNTDKKEINNEPDEGDFHNYLKIRPYDKQTDCDICPPNLCKGKVLRKYLKEHGPFHEVYYVGDGHNDVCPALQLKPSDTLFVRRGFKLDKIIQNKQIGERTIELQCNIVFWNDGKEIQQIMKF